MVSLLELVGPNPKFSPVAGYHWFDGDGMIHGLRIKDGKATYLSRYVKTSRLEQEEYFGGAKFMKFGDLKGFFGLVMVHMQMLRSKLKVLDLSYGQGTGNIALIYHHGKLLALSERDKPCKSNINRLFIHQWFTFSKVFYLRKNACMVCINVC